MLRRWRYSLPAAGVWLLAGCSPAEVGDGLVREPVSGKVTLDGRPLDSASIQFIPVDPNSPGGTSETIKDGSYQIGKDRGPTAGSYKVSISTVFPSSSNAGEAPGEIPKPKPDPIPEKYHTKTILKADIKPGGPNTLDFALEGKK